MTRGSRTSPRAARPLQLDGPARRPNRSPPVRRPVAARAAAANAGGERLDIVPPLAVVQAEVEPEPAAVPAGDAELRAVAGALAELLWTHGPAVANSLCLQVRRFIAFLMKYVAVFYAVSKILRFFDIGISFSTTVNVGKCAAPPPALDPCPFVRASVRLSARPRIRPRARALACLAPPRLARAPAARLASPCLHPLRHLLAHLRHPL